jgi:dCMP deaminase
MPERPTFPEIYMTLARALAARSTCVVERVGAVITSVDFRKVLAIGYTGNATGLPNRCDREGPDCGCLHAEENAIIHCDAPRSEPKIVFSTRLPCRACAKRLINLGGVQDLYTAGGDGAPASVDAGIVELLGSVGIRVHRIG